MDYKDRKLAKGSKKPQIIPHLVAGGKRILGICSCDILSCSGLCNLQIPQYMDSSRKNPSLYLRNISRKTPAFKQLESNQLGPAKIPNHGTTHKNRKMKIINSKSNPK